MTPADGILWGGPVFDGVFPSVEERERDAKARIHAMVDALEPGDSIRIERHDETDGRLYTLTTPADESGATMVFSDPTASEQT